MRKRLRCYLGFHRWQRTHSAAGGSFYLKCRDSGKYHDVPPTGPM